MPSAKPPGSSSPPVGRKLIGQPLQELIQDAETATAGPRVMAPRSTGLHKVEMEQPRVLLDPMAFEDVTEKRLPEPLTRRPAPGPRRTTPGIATAENALPPPPVVEEPEEEALPPSPSGSRIALQLARVLKRKREEIRISLPQVAALSGIAAPRLAGYEADGKVPFDHVLVLARILGVAHGDLPGMRSSGESPVGRSISTVKQALAETLRLTYRGAGRDELAGSLDAVQGAPEFAVEIVDDGVGELRRGSLLAFVRERGAVTAGAAALQHAIVVANHLRSGILSLRRLQGDLLVGLSPDAPSYHIDPGEWDLCGRMVMILDGAAAK